MSNACVMDGADAGIGDLVAWIEHAPRQMGLAREGGPRHVTAWVVGEAGRGARRVLILAVTASTGAAAYVAGAVLRRQIFALRRHGLRRQARIGETAVTAPQPAEQRTLTLL